MLVAECLSQKALIAGSGLNHEKPSCEWQVNVERVGCRVHVDGDPDRGAHRLEGVPGSVGRGSFG
jgi:hypothetical protein